jgi:hypothetical protein
MGRKILDIMRDLFEEALDKGLVNELDFLYSLSGCCGSKCKPGELLLKSSLPSEEKERLLSGYNCISVPVGHFSYFVEKFRKYKHWGDLEDWIESCGTGDRVNMLQYFGPMNGKYFAFIQLERQENLEDSLFQKKIYLINSFARAKKIKGTEENAANFDKEYLEEKKTYEPIKVELEDILSSLNKFDDSQVLSDIVDELEYDIFLGDQCRCCPNFTVGDARNFLAEAITNPHYKELREELSDYGLGIGLVRMHGKDRKGNETRKDQLSIEFTKRYGKIVKAVVIST